MTMNTTPSADLSYSTAPIRSVTLFWVTPSLYPIALQHTVRIHPTTDPSNNPLYPLSGDHRPLSKSTTLALFCFNPSHPVPNESLRIISAYLWTSGILKSQTICRVIMVYSPTKMQQFILSSSNAVVYSPTNIHLFLTDSRSRKIIVSQWFTLPPRYINSSPFFLI